MPAERASFRHPHALGALILVAALLATWFAYAPGIGGSLHFDDYPSLQGLALIDDAESSFRFVATGTAGPLGRPIALASFVPQAYAWPDAPDVFLRTNILIHLLNGVLVTWFLYLLGVARKQTEQQAVLIAAGAGAIWMLMPLLASSSLFIVQRMTTLSAVFVLLGAVGYLYARQSLDHRPLRALIGMTLAVGTGATLGALAKENGALLVLFVLAVEATLLHRPSTISRALWRAWFSVVLAAPLAILVFYLGTSISYPENIVLTRNFDGFERLITQAEILWKYLYLALLPNVPSLGPFHDDYPIRKSLLNPATLLSVVAWAASITAAFMLRRKAPLFTFGVAWYLLGHLLESTTLALELYFEHRNYLPLVGPAYALVASMAHLEKKTLRLAAIGLLGYAGILGMVLFSITSLWGWPAIAAEMWHVYKPNSLRAVQYLDEKLQAEGDIYSARRVLHRFIDANPEAYGVHLQLLLISCQLEPESDHSESIQFLERKLRITRFNYSVVTGFQMLYELSSEGRCTSIKRTEIYRLGLSLLENPGFNLPVVRHNIHAVMATIGIDNGDYYGVAMYHMQEALKAYHNPDTLLYAIGILNSGKRYDASWELLEEARARKTPINPIRAFQRKQELDRIEAIMRDFQ